MQRFRDAAAARGIVVEEADDELVLESNELEVDNGVVLESNDDVILESNEPHCRRRASGAQRKRRQRKGRGSGAPQREAMIGPRELG